MEIVTGRMENYRLINRGNRNEYYNSKEGRMHDAAAQEATQGGTVRG